MGAKKKTGSKAGKHAPRKKAGSGRSEDIARLEASLVAAGEKGRAGARRALSDEEMAAAGGGRAKPPQAGTAGGTVRKKTVGAGCGQGTCA